MLANNVGVASGLAWELNRHDIILFGQTGELKYGLGYPDVKGRFVSNGDIAQWLETHRQQGPVSLVILLSKNDDIENWHDRNTAYLTRLEFEAGDGSVIIALADKVSNLTDMIRNHQKYGSEFWQHFNLQPLEQLWWYTSVLQVAKKRVPECPLNAELEALIEEFCIEVVGDIAQKRAAASEL